MRSVLGVHWKDWCWSWNSSTLATSCEELTRWKRPWCWEGSGAGGEGDGRGWDGWMASPTLWAWVWVNSGSWWWTGRPGVLRFMGLQRAGHDWATELNWTDLYRVWKEEYVWLQKTLEFSVFFIQCSKWEIKFIIFMNVSVKACSHYYFWILSVICVFTEVQWTYITFTFLFYFLFFN